VRGLHDAVDGSVGIIHFDAHLDLMDENERQGRFSHSSGMRRALDLQRVSPGDCIQIARATSIFQALAAYKQSVDLRHVSAGSATGWAPKLCPTGFGSDSQRGLSLSRLDIDAIDPAFAPGAGAHERVTQLPLALDAVARGRRMPRFAVTEVNR